MDDMEPEHAPAKVAASGPVPGLLPLEEALQRIPESLQKEMKELLRADFSQVRPWKPGQS